METTVVLCAVPELDMNHNHTYTFDSKQAQLNFFNSRKTLVFNEVMYQKDNDSIKLDIVYGNSKLMASNYLYFRNPDDNVIHYCFIVNKKYINENTTQLFLKLDVMQTYLVNIDYYLNSCFIERQHMNPAYTSGKPNLDVLNRPEDIECGEYVIKSVTNLFDFRDKGGYIVASTDKLSKKGENQGVGDPKPEPGGGTTPGGGGTKPSVTGEMIVNSARKLIGKPYIFGGNYPPLGSDSGTDCSGLCRWAYNDNGLGIPRTTYEQIKYGKDVNGSSLKPGDLIFTIWSSPGVPEHVFMFAHYNDDGSFQVIEAREPGTNIGEFTRTWKSDYRAKRYIAVNASQESQAVPQPSNPDWDSFPSNVKNFINAVYSGANDGYHKYGLFASVTIAQGALETGWNSSPPGNNLFGIKADSSWTGKTFTTTTQEDYGYGLVTITDTFRAYDSIHDSIIDRCKFLQENERYVNAGVFAARTPQEQIQALKNAGYATDPYYVSKLMQIVNDFNLTVYDI